MDLSKPLAERLFYASKTIGGLFFCGEKKRQTDQNELIKTKRRKGSTEDFVTLLDAVEDFPIGINEPT